MIYFIEIVLRLLYTFLSIVVTSFVIYYFKDEIYFYLLYNESFNQSYYSLNLERCFVLRSPIELLNSEILASFFLAVIFTLPFFLYNFTFFIASALNKKEYLGVLVIVVQSVGFFYLSNIVFIVIFFPYFVTLLENFILLETIKSFNIEYQPGVEFFISLYNELTLYFNLLLLIFFSFIKVSLFNIKFLKLLILFSCCCFLLCFLYLFFFISFSPIFFLFCLTFLYFLFNFIIRLKTIPQHVLKKFLFYF